MKTRVLALLLFVLSLPLLAQPGRDQRGNSSRPLDNQPVQPLSAEEEKSLYLMREEEKLAHDVYQALYARWNLPVFQNIAASEQRHTDRIKMLLDRYGLKDPIIVNRAFSPTRIFRSFTAFWSNRDLFPSLTP